MISSNDKVVSKDDLRSNICGKEQKQESQD